MAALTGNQILKLQGGVAGCTVKSRRVLANTHIRKGGMVGITAAGFARPFTAGDQFGGHALQEVNNNTATNGKYRVDCAADIYTVTVPAFDSVTIANFGDAVGAASDNHADLTQTATNQVGVIADVNDNGVAVTFKTADAGGA